MTYTEFRKFYGDFEIVIPAINFSSLARLDAIHAVTALRHYEYGHVCSHLDRWGLEHAADLIDEMLTEHTRARYHTLNSLIVRQFHYDDNMPSFRICHQSGITLRKAWCEHMANEIEREFGLTL